MRYRKQGILQKITPEYSQRLLLIEDSIDRIPTKFEFATVEASFHAHRLIEIMDNMIPDKALEEFNELEAFSLLSSAFLHDVGYLIGLRSKDIRKGHPKLSAKFVRSEFGRLGLDPTEALIIATICRAHTLDFDLSSVSTILQVGRHKVRLRFLSALLRLADALDIDFRRSPPAEITSLTDKHATEFWATHQSVSGISFLPDEGEIQIHFISFPDEISQKLILRLVHSLRKVLDSVHQILVENGVPYRKIVYKVYRFPTE